MSVRDLAMVIGLGLAGAVLAGLISLQVLPRPVAEPPPPPSVDPTCAQARQDLEQRRDGLRQDVDELSALLERMKSQPPGSVPPATDEPE